MTVALKLGVFPGSVAPLGTVDYNDRVLFRRLARLSY